MILIKILAWQAVKGKKHSLLEILCCSKHSNWLNTLVMKPVYLVVDVKIDDVGAYGKYKEKVKPLIESYGGEYLSRGGEINVLENELWEPTRMVLVKFPDKESAMNWYNCDEYQALKKIRINNATSTSLIIEGL